MLHPDQIVIDIGKGTAYFQEPMTPEERARRDEGRTLAEAKGWVCSPGD